MRYIDLHARASDVRPPHSHFNQIVIRRSLQKFHVLFTEARCLILKQIYLFISINIKRALESRFCINRDARHTHALITEKQSKIACC